MTNSQSSSDALNELEWLAFRYIAGELTADEIRGFESVLAEDQAAREAVARAVHVSEVASLAQVDLVGSTVCRPVRSDDSFRPRTAATSRPSWARRLAWMASGAAACLLLVFLARPFESTHRGTSVGSGARSTEQADPDLALAWAQTRSSAEEPGDADASSSHADLTSVIDADELVELDLAAPSWMLTAVVGLQASPDDSDSVNN